MQHKQLRNSTVALSLLCSPWLGLTGCSRDEKPMVTANPVVVASALAPSQSSDTKAEAWTIAADGGASFEMVGKDETIKGKLGATKGSLQINPMDLTQTRGEVAIDVTTLTTQTFTDAARDGKQTRDALIWLEVGEVTAANLKSEFRYSTFAIREIRSASVKDVTKLPGNQRRVTLTTVGDFLLHGKKSEQVVDLDVEFSFAGDKPTAVSIRTAKPFVVNLLGHEVKPRDNVGKLLASVTQLLSDKVSETASVSLELRAAPGGMGTMAAEPAKMPDPAPAASASGGPAAGEMKAPPTTGGNSAAP